MNKKFIKVSLILCLPFLLIIGASMMILGPTSDESGFEGFPEEPVIEYKSYKEDKNNHIITLTLKNNTKNIATINDMNLSFNYKQNQEYDDGAWSIYTDFYFKGQEDDKFDEEPVYGIDPGTEKDIIFNIPKAVKLDEEVFDLDNPEVHYNYNFYKHRSSKNSLMFGSGGMGGSMSIGIK